MIQWPVKASQRLWSHFKGVPFRIGFHTGAKTGRRWPNVWNCWRDELMHVQSAVCTSFLKKTLVQCCKPAERQPARGSASTLGSLQLQLHPCTNGKEKVKGRKPVRLHIYFICQKCKTMPHLSSCSWERENSKGTVKTASVTSEPRADWAVSVKREIFSKLAFTQRMSVGVIFYLLPFILWRMALAASTGATYSGFSPATIS